ncbi:MAG TPA: transcriptional regulator, partial [Gallicola sp.]|nr:transcriptional regulator [Gallicola sp.]
TPRQVRKYKNDFEKAGIYIEAVKGRYGGYYYDSGEKLFEISFDIKELNILEKINLNINDQSYSDIDKIILENIYTLLEE